MFGIGKAGYDTNIDALMGYEAREIEEMKKILKAISEEINEMKHLERNLDGLEDFFNWTLQTKKWFEEHYDVKMLRAEDNPDEKRAWKRAKYKKMAKLSAKLYKKLTRALETFNEIEMHKKRFEILNQKLKTITLALLPQLRKEYYEEKVESKA